MLNMTVQYDSSLNDLDVTQCHRATGKLELVKFILLLSCMKLLKWS